MRIRSVSLVPRPFIACAEAGREKAQLRLRKARERILAPSDFNVKLPAKPKEVRKRFADAGRGQGDCRGSELGEVMPGALPPPVEAAARGLEVGGVSDVSDSDEGVHLLLRTA